MARKHRTKMGHSLDRRKCSLLVGLPKRVQHGGKKTIGKPKHLDVRDLGNKIGQTR